MDDKTVEIEELFQKWEMSSEEQVDAFREFLQLHGLTGQFLEEIKMAAELGALD